ncbi:Auxin Efflux Carrier [Alkaliphilus metalliredigens QYMF]|uniref:Auxin Efflux Carrier n=1 Tax=Alkaliphilus metalliredigens (strain QYMF) TaxID=293826 RepID=A6TSE3_ALKMQ|nr:AEC family transporter [Alkaliphilus metalliredigens]ABR49111.1 Auxin Efflux Carrier [Alkaliphilus metalliredigens QYMF]
MFFSIVFPVFMIIGLGYVFGRNSEIDMKAPSRLAIYIFNPALYFNSMITARVENDEFIKVIIYAALLFISCTAIVYMVNHFLLKYPQNMRSPLLLSTVFPNTGNYGLPIVLFAFGNIGFERAVVFTVFQSFLINSAGVYFASNSENNIKDSLKNMLKMPGFIALIVAILMKNFNLLPPDFMMKPIELLGQAAIPTLLIILGIQLSKAKIVFDWKFITTSVILRLFIYPLMAFILIPLFFDLQSVTGKVLLVLAATPSAVSTTLFAIQFNAKPQLVSTITLITTLLSVGTISVLLTIIL